MVPIPIRFVAAFTDKVLPLTVKLLLTVATPVISALPTTSKVAVGFVVPIPRRFNPGL